MISIPSWNTVFLSLPFMMFGVFMLLGSAVLANSNHQGRLTQMKIVEKEVEQRKVGSEIKLLVLRAMLAGSPLDRIMTGLCGMVVTAVGVYILLFC